MSEQITTADLDLLDANLRAMHEDGRPGSKVAKAYVGNLVLRAPALIAAARRAERYETALREIQRVERDADGDHLDQLVAIWEVSCRALALTPEPPTIAS